MGSVMGHIECPRCNSQDCFEDYNYKTGEEYVSCPDCGYSRTFVIKRDDEGKMIKKDESRDLAFGNLITEETLLEEPFGAFLIQYDSGFGSGGTLLTEDAYNTFVSYIVSLTKQLDHKMERAVVSRFVDGEIKKEVIWGTIKKEE